MNEKFLVLERNIQRDLEAIDDLYEALGSPDLRETSSQEELIVVSYRLHSLYTALENIFRNIASAPVGSASAAGGSAPGARAQASIPGSDRAFSRISPRHPVGAGLMTTAFWHGPCFESKRPEALTASDPSRVCLWPFMISLPEEKRPC
jgi:hypothetical protein